MSRMISSLALGAVVTLSLVGTSLAAGLQLQSGLSERAIIIVSGKGSAVSLNPQPLPPAEKSIIVVGGKGAEVCLNPQPLPPKEKAIIIVGGKSGAACLNPQPLPPKELFAN